MKRWLSISVLYALLAGCSTSPIAPALEIDPLEQNAVNAVRVAAPDLALAAVDAALRRYQSLDDLAGQWRMHYLRARLAMRYRRERVEEDTQALVSLAHQVNSVSMQFDTEILLGRIAEGEGHFVRAQALAETDIQRAVAHAYLQEYERALALVSVDPPGTDQDKAFVYYRVAQQLASSALFEKALLHYGRAGDPRGVGDCLFQLARLVRDESSSEAIDFAGRAINVLRASGYDVEAEHVRRWIDSR